jgi:alkaline phosphatase
VLCRLFGVLLAASASVAAGEHKARNVILMISDGCGANSIAAAGYYEYGELGRQPYDSFPVKLACTTFALMRDGEPMGYDPAKTWSDFDFARNGPVTDSAASATALNTGVKTLNGRICIDHDGKPLTTFAQIADRAGKATGSVTTVPLCHATPAGVWAHSVSRNDYPAIAHEMIYESGLDVIVGAGNPLYDNDSRPAREMDYQYVGGEKDWADISDADGANGFSLVQTREDFEAVAAGKNVPAKLLGIPMVHGSLQFSRAGRGMGKLNEKVPTLATMSVAALNVLAQDDDGFYLMIEGGAVDSANHANNIGRMIEEEIDFNHAVAAVVQWVEKHSSWDDTLVIVTADHECGMLWGAGTYEDANGNRHYNEGTDKFVAWKDIPNAGKGNVPDVQYCSGGHTNLPVPLFARGAGSEAFEKLIDGTDPKYGPYVDDTDVFTVMAAAIADQPTTRPAERATTRPAGTPASDVPATRPAGQVKAEAQNSPAGSPAIITESATPVPVTAEILSTGPIDSGTVTIQPASPGYIRE